MLDGGQYSASSYQSSSLGVYGDINGGTSEYDTTAGTTVAPTGGANHPNYSSYDQLSYPSSMGDDTAAFDVNAASSADLTGAGMGTSSSLEASNTPQQIQQYPTNAQGLYKDPNPQIIRRPAQDQQVTYTQNIKIRFLQPPAIPAPGVSLLLIFSL